MSTTASTSQLAGRAALTTAPPDDGEGSAAQTFAIGFAIGGTLLLIGAVSVLVLQSRRKKSRFCCRKSQKEDVPLVSVISTSRTANISNGGTLQQEHSPTRKYTGRFMRVPSFTSASLNCFGPALPHDVSPPGPAPTSPPPPERPPKPRAQTLPNPLPSGGSEHEYSEAMYRMPVDALVGENEDGDQHTYADPDTSHLVEDGIEDVCGLEYRSVPVIMQDRKTKAATMHISATAGELVEDYSGPYKTTDLVRSTSLMNMATASSQQDVAYLVRPIGGGTWNKRGSADNAAVPTPNLPPKEPTSPFHQRSASMGQAGAAARKPRSGAPKPTFADWPGPKKASSLSNLLAHDPSPKSKQGASFRSASRVPMCARNDAPVVSHLALAPPKPPRIKHVDPNYIFLSAQRKQNSAQPSPSAASEGIVVHRPLQPSKSVPTRLHAAHKRASTASVNEHGKASIVLHAVPRPFIRMASSEEIELPVTMRQPSLPQLAQPLIDIDSQSGCDGFILTAVNSASKRSSRLAGNADGTPPNVVIEIDDDEDLSHLPPGLLLTRRLSRSLPDLSELAISHTGSRMKDRWDQCHLSTLREWSRDDSDMSHPASLDDSFQQFRAEKRLLQPQLAVIDDDISQGRGESTEPNYWVLETQPSLESIGSMQ